MLDAMLSVVLPAHNEEANIEEVVRSCLTVLPGLVREFEVIVVDDGSWDATPQIIDRLAAEDTRVVALHHAVNRGYGDALTTGFAHTRGDYVMFMDADRQFDIADLERFLPYIGTYDIVAGYRIVRRDPWLRLLYAAIFNLAVRVFFGIRLRDIDCAFKVFRGDLLRGMDLTFGGALINTEMLAKARKAGASLTEVGVHHYPRLVGKQSGGSFRVIFRAMRDFFRLWASMQRYVPPSGIVVRQPLIPEQIAAIAVGSGLVVGALFWAVRRLLRK
ncbi:MAG: glycosyltransferase family 2 protein [Chloroflexia bacterium]